MDRNGSDRPSIPPKRGIFDVVRPGRTPASPTSRPVVNGQRPVQDTSVTVGAPSVPRGLMDSKQKISVTSPSSSPSSVSAHSAPQHNSISRPMHQPPVHSRPYSHQTQQPMQAPQDVGEAAVVGEVTRPEGVSEPNLHEQPEHEHHRSILSEVLAIIAIVFLIAVIVNILVDADILDLPIPHTNFFEY